MDLTKDSPQAPAPHRLAYTGQGLEIARILIWNGFLTILTLGIYRFWAKTRFRQYVWGSFELDDDAVEYSGTGGELFKGFLVVFLSFLIFSVAVLFSGLIFGEGSALYYMLQGLNSLVFLFLLAIAPFFAHRYRITRTWWRGIRGGFTGNLTEYVTLVLKYALLNVVTLGVTYPLGSMARQNYLLSHSAFGNLPMSCQATVGPAWAPWLLLYVSLVLAAGGSGFLLGLGLIAAAMGGAAFFIPVMIVAFLFTLFGAVFYVLYRLRELRQILTSLSIGPVQVRSGLRSLPLLGRLIGAIAAIVITSYLLPVLVVVVMVTQDAAPGDFGIFLMVFIVYPLLLVIGVIVWSVMWLNPFYRTLAETTRFVGTFDPAEMMQNTSPVPTRGEGLVELVG